MLSFGVSFKVDEFPQLVVHTDLDEEGVFSVCIILNEFYVYSLSLGVRLVIWRIIMIYFSQWIGTYKMGFCLFV